MAERSESPPFDRTAASGPPKSTLFRVMDLRTYPRTSRPENWVAGVERSEPPGKRGPVGSLRSTTATPKSGSRIGSQYVRSLILGIDAVRRWLRHGSPMDDASWAKTTARRPGLESTLRPGGRRESSCSSENTKQRVLLPFLFPLGRPTPTRE